MATALNNSAGVIGEAQSDLLNIDKSLKSLYMLLDEFQVLEERGQLSSDVVEEVSAIVQEELLKAGQRISQAREVIARFTVSKYRDKGGMEEKGDVS